MNEDAFAGRSLGRSMLRIAVPLTFSSAVRYGVELSNAYWVGKLGVGALSIVTALGTFMTLSKMFAGITSAGTSAVVGRMIGEDRHREAARVAQKITAVALVLGAAIALLALLVSKWALDALSFQGAIRVEARAYLDVLLAGLPCSFGMMAMNGVLVGLGRPRASMVASTTSFLVGFALTPLLLRGVGVGVWGAGVALVAGDACGYVIGLNALRRYVEPAHRLTWRRRLSKLHELWPVVRVGAPLTADAIVHGTVWFALIAFLSRFGGEYVAAQGTEERITQILNVPTEGVAPATATLVGYTLGKGRRGDALRVVRMALIVVVTIALGGAAFLSFAPAPMVAWICNDPEFVNVGVRVLAVAAIGLVFLGSRDVLEAAFGGVGNTLPPVFIGFAVALARFPLAYLLAVRSGAGGLGVAWAVNGTIAVQTLALGAWFILRFDRMNARALRPIAASLPPPA
ncbi:MAG TPA: MATE family efflux transporter [Labilithrix sp.]|nr:MATE family efflux transporter [Labilithrix sp.]